jgi:hypothetical protein
VIRKHAHPSYIAGGTGTVTVFCDSVAGTEETQP